MSQKRDCCSSLFHSHIKSDVEVPETVEQDEEFEQHFHIVEDTVFCINNDSLMVQDPQQSNLHQCILNSICHDR